MIHSSAIVDPSAKLGEGTDVWAFAQIREGAELGESCIVGNGSYIDKGVKIGNRVKLINKVLVHRGVLIEDDVFLGPFVCFANDKNPRHNLERDLEGIEWKVKKGASIGAGAIIMPDVNVGSYSLVGAGSIVTKNVPDHGLAYGSPAKLLGFVCFCGKRLQLERAIEEGGEMKLSCLYCKKEVTIKSEDFSSL